MALFTERYLVIDYGSSYIKGALYQNGPGGTRILRMESLPIVSVITEDRFDLSDELQAPEGESPSNQVTKTIQATALMQKAELGEYEYNLVRYVLSFFPEQINYIINIPLERVYVRDLTIPVTNLKQIDEIIPFEVENLIPLPLDDVEVLGLPWGIDEDSAKVVSFSAERATLSEIVEPLQNTETTIKMLSVDAVGLSGFVKLLPLEIYENKTIAQVDIGGDYTIFNVVQNGNLVFTRKLPIGGSDINQIVSEEMGISIEAAEQRKIELHLDMAMLGENLEKDESFYKRLRIEPKQHNVILRKVGELYQELISELERSVLSLSCEQPSIFYLSGGGALQPGIIDYLTQGIASPVKEYPVHLTNGEPAALWATTIGTGAMYRRKASEKLDFLNTVFGQTLRGGELNFSMFSTPIMILLFSAVIFLISLVGSVYLDKRQIATNLMELAKVSKTIPGIKSGNNANFEVVLKNIKQICRTRLRSAGSGGEGDSLLSILKEISKYTPDKGELDFRLRQFNFDGESVKFDAEVKRYEDTSVLIAALKKSKLFYDVKLADNRRSYNQKIIQITVQMKINKQSAAASASCK